MKPKDYIRKYRLDEGWYPYAQESFLKDLSEDFSELLERNGANGNLHGFDNAVNEIRAKWDAISNKVRNGLPEGVWRFFYASAVIPERDRICPGMAEMRRSVNAEKPRTPRDARMPVYKGTINIKAQ